MANTRIDIIGYNPIAAPDYPPEEAEDEVIFIKNLLTAIEKGQQSATASGLSGVLVE